MIDRLQRSLTDLEHLTPDEQEEVALYIEALRSAHGHETLFAGRESAPPWQDPAGAWSDVPEDDEAEAYYRMRHETKPSASVLPLHRQLPGALRAGVPAP